MGRKRKNQHYISSPRSGLFLVNVFLQLHQKIAATRLHGGLLSNVVPKCQQIFMNKRARELKSSSDIKTTVKLKLLSLQDNVMKAEPCNQYISSRASLYKCLREVSVFHTPVTGTHEKAWLFCLL